MKGLLLMIEKRKYDDLDLEKRDMNGENRPIIAITGAIIICPIHTA